MITTLIYLVSLIIVLPNKSLSSNFLYYTIARIFFLKKRMQVQNQVLYML
jgi:hypothetical protein